MKKRSIVIMLALTLLLVLAIAGTALAKYTKGAPEIIDASCSWTHPDWAMTRTGDYTFHIEWSTDAGKPVNWQIYRYGSDGLNYEYTKGPVRLTAAQIKAGKADITLSNHTPGAYNTFRVWLHNREGTVDYVDFYVSG